MVWANSESLCLCCVYGPVFEAAAINGPIKTILPDTTY